MSVLLEKSSLNAISDDLHINMDDGIKDKQYKTLLTYFAISEVMEDENFYTIDKLIIDHLLEANYLFDIKLINDSCEFVDSYLIELTVYLEDCDMDKYKTICYIDKDVYRELEEHQLVINQ